MTLLIVFFLSILLTEGVAVAFSLLVEFFSTSFVSLVTFFPMFFAAIYASWRFSVWYTRPAAQRA